MNVQYLADPPSKNKHSDAHTILKKVAGRLASQAQEDSKAIVDAVTADEAADKEMEEKIAQLEKDLAAKQKEKDEISQAAAGAQLELIEARKKHDIEEEQIKKLGEAAEASSNAVKALEEDITACNVKFKNLLEEKENISKKLKNQKETAKECNEGRRNDKKKASEALEAEKKKTEGQKKLKEQAIEEREEGREKCEIQKRKDSKELAEKYREISKLADDVEREAAAVKAANDNAKVFEDAVNEKTDEIAKLNSKIKRLEAENTKLKENSSGIPDGKHDIKVCRMLGTLKSCSTIKNVEVKDGKVTGESIGKTDGADKYSVEKGKGGKIVLSQGAFKRLKFNPLIKF